MNFFNDFLFSGLQKENCQDLKDMSLELVNSFLIRPNCVSCHQLRFCARVLEALNSMPVEALDASLSEVNKNFVSAIESVPQQSTDQRCLFQCLLKIGLSDAHLREKLLNFLSAKSNSHDIFCRFESREVLRYLQNPQLTLAVIEESKNNTSIDWSLPFLEDYVIAALEEHNQKPRIPFSVTNPCRMEESDISSSTLNETILERKISENDTKISENDTKISENATTSCYATPRLSLQRNPSESQSLPNTDITESHFLSNSSQYSVSSLSLQPNHGSPSPCLEDISLGKDSAQKSPAKRWVFFFFLFFLSYLCLPLV